MNNLTKTLLNVGVGVCCIGVVYAYGEYKYYSGKIDLGKDMIKTFGGILEEMNEKKKEERENIKSRYYSRV